MNRAGSTGDTSPRSCSSKESTPSPFHSPRSSVYVSSADGVTAGSLFGGSNSSGYHDEQLNEEEYFDSKRCSGILIRIFE